MRYALRRLNRNMTLRVETLNASDAMTPRGRCGVGFNADFPAVVVLTVLSSTGSWGQVSIDPKGELRYPDSLRSGADYTTALGGESLSEFFANLAPCHLNGIVYFVLGRGRNFRG